MRRRAAKRAAQALNGSYPINTPTDKMSDGEEEVPNRTENAELPAEQCERDASMVCEMRDREPVTVLTCRAPANVRPRGQLRPVCRQAGRNNQDVAK